MKKNRFYLLIGVFFCIIVFSCTNQNKDFKIVELWEGNPPTNNEVTKPEESLDNDFIVANVSTAQMLIYKPQEKKNNKCIIICVGGAYEFLALAHEGKALAKWFNEKGMTAIVLKYRTANKHKEVPLDDLQKTIRYIRKNTESLGVNSNEVGLVGFSAGGHLVATASVYYDKDTRPDFTIFFYPVITMGEYTNTTTMQNLLGDDPSEEDINYFSIENHVSENTPPAILFHSHDDKEVPSENSILYYSALKRNKVSTSMYIFPKGGHGWGMSPFHGEFKYYYQMLDLLEKWLSELN